MVTGRIFIALAILLAAVGAYFAMRFATDEDPAPNNDLQADNARVHYLDVGVSDEAIIAPASTVDTGSVVTPRVWVYNYGNETASFPVVMRIGAISDQDEPLQYSDTQYVTNLGPGDWMTVSFAQWTATERGRHTVTCSTMLTGDQNPENDAISGRVAVRAPASVSWFESTIRGWFRVAIRILSGAMAGVIVTSMLYAIVRLWQEWKDT